MKILVQKCTKMHFLKSVYRSLQTPSVVDMDIGGRDMGGGMYFGSLGCSMKK
jgi:hypothetical protein